MKKSILTLAIAGVLTVGGTVLAFADNTEALGCFGKNGTTGVQYLMEEEGLTFEEAKTQKLEEKFQRVDAAVERGTVTAEEAVTIKAEMESNSAQCTTPGENKGTCDGYGLNQGLGGNGEGCGLGNGSGAGNGCGKGQGGRGAGMGLRNGGCNNN